MHFGVQATGTSFSPWGSIRQNKAAQVGKGDGEICFSVWGMVNFLPLEQAECRRQQIKVFTEAGINLIHMLINQCYYNKLISNEGKSVNGSKFG
jgi:hypothetical protein